MQGAELTFPNPSRSYEATGQGVRFWGYDRTFEVAFFVGSAVLTMLDSQTVSGEAGLLHTFDVHRDKICAAAIKVYSRPRRAPYVYSYTLTNSDF